MDEIFTLKLNGITPIVTHPERNSIIQHDPDILYELVNRGALVQITAMSITGDFGELVKQTVEMMLKHGKRGIHLMQVSTTYSMLVNGKQTLLAVSISTIILHEYREFNRRTSRSRSFYGLIECICDGAKVIL